MPVNSPVPRRFRIQADDGEVQDLLARLERTRFPDQQLGVEWEQGTDVTYLKVTATSCRRPAAITPLSLGFCA